MNMKTIHVAIIGAGFAGNFHCNAYRKVNTVDVVLDTVCDTNLERAGTLGERWGFRTVTDSYAEVLNNPQIDLIDITLPPVLHIDSAVQALRAGKDVICEKPLTGYFGREGDAEPIGTAVSKRKMYETLLDDMERVRQAVENSDRLFMYAENYIYSPAVVKAAELLRAKRMRTLYSTGECSIHCTTSALSSDWKNCGGGTLMRLGSHPIAGVLYLKEVEAKAHGEQITVTAVTANTAQICTRLTREERRYLPAEPHDVEDFATLTLEFSDGSRSVILCNDNTMGGIRNIIRLYGNEGVIECNMTPADNMSSYFCDDRGLEDVYISENLRKKDGWNRVFVAEETLRGYAAELSAFAECTANRTAPESDFRIAYETTRIMYAAYLSAEEGRRVTF